MKSYPNVHGSSKPTGYSHVVSATGSKMVYVAGQIGLDAEGKLVGAGDMAAQAKQVYVNIGHALAAAGATFADVVKLNTYIVGLDAERMAAARAARSAHFAGPNFPASTLVGVTALAMDGLMIEVEVVAIVE
jgi:enamine deaminase RidA (YjgF/YER057c/UK114 family)